MEHSFFDPAVWEQAWREDADTTIRYMERAGIDPARTFDSKAEVFERQSFSEEGKRRSSRILNWLEAQGVDFDGLTVLDIGAASGVFTIPMAERGARVTAVESSPPQVELLQRNAAHLRAGQVTVVGEPFERLDLAARGWHKAFDLVFVSMCPVIVDWSSVERVLACARQYSYISLTVGGTEHGLLDEIAPLLAAAPSKPARMEMAYLLHLLLLKGYAFESLVTRETKTVTATREAALAELMSMAKLSGRPEDARARQRVQAYLESQYPAGEVQYEQGGRFGKVLIRLQDERMQSGEPRS
ncbi:methyltransferase domain-containing protein [Paenibacillus sp. IB182496]|uniref:Methyltransferase domain-containing protein n=1 Tax=Paenibacillus sabuli TaxID=2772509 RepID=A0A927BRC4_9BACL|nr:class I SAM-dependent methyltransferase [Paenibacillus sabuli]MBD2845337.1 methyltransferase domain-containing protein [Paenibacillus sabuli]